MKIKKQVQTTKSRSKKEFYSNLYANIDWEKAAVLFQRFSSSANNNRSAPSTKEILRMLTVVGAVGLMFVFPGAAPALGSLVLSDKPYSRWRTKQVLTQLKRQKFVTIKNHEDGRVTVKITRNGMVRALTYQLELMQLAKPKKWDKKWRVVIFDIPERERRVRDVFRMRLHQLGLYQLQESVYVCPYPCFNEVEFLRELYGIPFTVQYLLVEKIENDSFLREHFEL